MDGRVGSRFDLAAQLAFYALLALFPFAIVVATLFGLLPIGGAIEELVRLVRAVAPPPVVPLLEGAIRNVVGGASPWLLAAGVGGALFFASNGVVALMAALNRAYGVAEDRPWLLRRLIAIGVTGASALLLIVGAALLLLGPSFARQLTGPLGLAHAFDLAWSVLYWPATIFVLIVLLAFLYWVCPSGRRPFRLFSPGALVAVPLWILVSRGFAFYVAHFGKYNRIYGALGAGVVLLLWIQLSALIVIVGGEISARVARSRSAGSI